VRCVVVFWYLTDKPERLAFVRYPTRADVLARVGFNISVVIKARSEQPDAWLCSFDLHQAGGLFQINAHSDLGDLIKTVLRLEQGMSSETDISALYHEFTDALTEVLAENTSGLARRGRLARARAAVKKHPNYNEHEYFLAVETAFKQWETIQNAGV
jgi:hypothetical protein